ncbi:MAG: PEP-CTERM sorting domain-containing protein [Atribacterota bacterium]
MRNITIIFISILVLCSNIFADSASKNPWPYYNKYQFRNHGIGWLHSGEYDNDYDLRIAPNGSGHIDNWDFKDSFSDELIGWRNKNHKKYYCRYYFDWRINNMVCHNNSVSAVPEPASLIFMAILSGALLSKKNKK